MSDGQTQPSTPPGASDEPSAEIPNPEDDEAIVTTDIGATGPALNTQDTEALAQAHEEIATLKDQILRAVAETENLRRRSQRELEEAGKYAVTGFARDLVGVVENLFRAADSLPRDGGTDPALAPIIQGIEMTLSEFTTLLERHHITRIDPIGQPFDHNLHQAVAQIETTEQPAGTVVQVMQSGYVIHDRLLRPAMVGVAKPPAGSAQGGDQDHIDTEA